jgi:hypothetical protein
MERNLFAISIKPCLNLVIGCLLLFSVAYAEEEEDLKPLFSPEELRAIELTKKKDFVGASRQYASLVGDPRFKDKWEQLALSAITSLERGFEPQKAEALALSFSRNRDLVSIAPEMLYQVCRIQAAQGEFVKATQTAQNAIRLYPDSFAAEKCQFVLVLLNKWRNRPIYVRQAARDYLQKYGDKGKYSQAVKQFLDEL